jgi:hypothetical protein
VATAYTVVLKKGERIEAKSPYQVEDGLVKFVGVDGTNYQFRLGEIDIPATRAANPGPRKVWTSEEVEQLVKRSPLSVVGAASTTEAAQEASPPTPPPDRAPTYEHEEMGTGELEASEGPPPESPPPPPPPPVAEEQPGATSEASKPFLPQEDTREYWQKRVKPLQEELAGIDREIANFRRGEGRADSNAVNLNVDAMGVNVDDTIRRLEQRRAQVEQQIEQIQLEAKRQGIPPGWVR